MARMDFIALFSENGIVKQRRTGFDSREVSYHVETDDPGVTAIRLKDNFDFLYIECSVEDFCEKKDKADMDDLHLMPITYN